MSEKERHELDNPFKQWSEGYIEDITAWLLDKNVRSVTSRNVEIPQTTKAMDNVFEVVLEDGMHFLLHLEFQGRSTKIPMRFRMLMYLGYIVSSHRLPVYSVVIYTGDRTGARDLGIHEAPSLGDIPSVVWRYRVVHLWDVDTDDLLERSPLSLVPIIGQTQLSQPKEQLARAIERIRTEAEDPYDMYQLMALFVAEKEILQMVTQLFAHDERMLDFIENSALLKQMREEGREEGEEIGILKNLRHNIGQIALVRFHIDTFTHQVLTQQLQAIDSESSLHQLFDSALKTHSFEDFRHLLEAILQSSDSDEPS